MPDDEYPKIIPLQDFLTEGYREGFGMTREEAWEQGICVSCKKPPTFYTEAGRREYFNNSAMCEACWDKMFADED